ncbi:nucleolar protein 4 isoform X2 [Phlebotomus papatasi]|uniref:nucleolar protein 4 isoform X2 n=1 Tax=Phlebotomus papatasi TaxID=29031 RepID=UPI002483758D|nr:nucleolar protein 4 isoform X2 [Phlebotomus papatasi]
MMTKRLKSYNLAASNKHYTPYLNDQSRDCTQSSDKPVKMVPTDKSTSHETTLECQIQATATEDAAVEAPGTVVDDSGERKRKHEECDENEANNNCSDTCPGGKKIKFDTHREKMIELYQPWVLKTYGDLAKTKTITLRKQARIIKALSGQETNNPDSSKFRFWVKAKGFTTERPVDFKGDLNLNEDLVEKPNKHCLLYVPNFTKETPQLYRRVAIVELFFDIIFGVHVGLGGRSGRHAGQKRTYRTITESYAFLPREAVTKFLSGCVVCKKLPTPYSPLHLDDAESPTECDSSPHQSVANSSDNRLLINNQPETRENCDLAESETDVGTEQKSTISSSIIQLPIDWEERISVEYNRVKSDQTEKSHTILNRDTQLAIPGNTFNGIPNIEHFNTTRSQLYEYYHLLKAFYDSSTQSKTPTNAAAVKAEQTNNFPMKPPPPMDEKDSKSIVINPPTLPFNEKNMCEMKIPCKTTPPKKRYNNYSQNVSKTREEDDTLPQSINFTGTSKISTAVIMATLRSNDPITSTYLKLTRSMGLSDEDALRIDDLESPTIATTSTGGGGSTSTTTSTNPEHTETHTEDPYTARNGTEGPDLGMVGGLWAQYQNALALNGKQLSPSGRVDPSSPVENQDETNSSGQKDDDELSEDDSEDRIDANAQDPERLKAFNMFVRLFVDENLDRMIPISKQPKEKIQAIIDSCTRQFPEFAERSRKRIRTYLKSCRRNKKTRDGWENTSRPTPAHLTSVQAEQILALACENESMNAKRMRLGLEPISQNVTPTVNTTVDTTIANYSIMKTATENDPINTPSTSVSMKTTTSATSVTDTKTINTTQNENGISTNTLYRADYSINSNTYNPRTNNYQNFFNNNTPSNVPTDLSMKQPQRPPILSHKLNATEMNAVRQLVTGYRESAAFLLRSADELEILLQQQQ